MSQDLQIDGIIIPVESILDFDQDYEPLGSDSFRRVASGAGILRSLGWSKVRTIINGRGWAPAGLAGLDQGTTHTIKCRMPNGVTAATNSVTLPAARRSDADHDPVGFALVGDELVPTNIGSIIANVATLDVVAGATAYEVWYWPELTVAVVRNTAKGQQDNSYQWTIEAEEI